MFPRRDSSYFDGEKVVYWVGVGGSAMLEVFDKIVSIDYLFILIGECDFNNRLIFAYSIISILVTRFKIKRKNVLKNIVKNFFFVISNIRNEISIDFVYLRKLD